MVDAPSAGRELHCVVVTPERKLLDEPADLVVLPLYDGELGVMPKRAPLIGRLGAGELRIRRGSTVKRYYIDGGFAQVRDDVVTVLTARALKPEEIDVKAAEAALTAATPNETAEAREAGQNRARAKIRVAGHRGTASAGSH
jgi:F-type H+-transporting ATPase subunit epsilon